MVKVETRPDLRLRLKENFDRFKMVVHKEKQMADFRRWFIALAVVALMAGAASAQVGVAQANGSASSALSCVANAAGTPELRPEGYTELVGDLLIQCTGGPLYQTGSQIPGTNITLYFSSLVPITSRFIGKENTSYSPSEALLIIDEAGSSITTGVPNFGPQAGQSLCTSAQQQQGIGGPCQAYVGVASGFDTNHAAANYEVALSAGGGAAQNVYQGSVGDYGVNTVTFYNVPVLPPATSGVTRTFRITNVRIPAPGYLSPNAQILAFISTSPNQVLPVTQSALTVGVVGQYMTAAVSANQTAFQQCSPATVALSANLIFTEGFATAFKTRVVPGGAANGNPAANTNIQWAAESTNLGPPTFDSLGHPTGNNQNIPGGLYGGFAANSESGFIFPALNTGITTSGAVNYTAGLADYGTRLKAVFTNIPSGLTLYVSTTSAATGAIPGGTSTVPFAVLVATNSGEATPDGTSFSPIAGGTSPGSSDGLPYIALAQNSAGGATAVWEVVNANPAGKDVLVFSVYVSYAPTSSSSSNPYGLPITGLPFGKPPSTVALSFAPEPGGGTFSATQLQGSNLPIPRFTIASAQGGPWINISLCQTTLLYPYVITIPGYDTGIAVSNTSMDNFNTTNQTGSCTLYGYGVTFGANGASTAAQPIVQGCDQMSSVTAIPGANCFGGPITASNPNGLWIPSGTTGVVMASAVLPPGFQGYVIASCNFHYAHGYAALTDQGLQRLWSSYLALELNPIAPSCSVIGGLNCVGSPRKGVQGIEVLAH